MKILPKIMRNVTRFEVIDNREHTPTNGRILVAYNKDMKIEFDLQDSGQTIKVILGDKHDTQATKKK